MADSANLNGFLPVEDLIPLTSADCDLRDFPYMPLMVTRLRRSKAWLMAKRQPELGFYMMNLWISSWHDKPAASLENDDDVLADLAMCTIEKWKKVRDKVLHGWVLCSDGRLYHPIVAERAAEAWQTRLAFRDRLVKARESKKAKQEAAAAPPPTQDSSIIDDTIDLKGKVEGKVEGKGEGRRRGRGDSSKEVKSARRAARLPADWSPNEEEVAYATTKGLDVAAVVENFRGWWHSVAGQKGVKLDWHLTWERWCRTCVTNGECLINAIIPQQRRRSSNQTDLTDLSAGLFGSDIPTIDEHGRIV